MFGKLAEYNQAVETWSECVELVNCFFDANDVKDEKKASIFLTMALSGQRTFEDSEIHVSFSTLYKRSKISKSESSSENEVDDNKTDKENNVKMTGVKLGRTVLNALKDLGLDRSKCIGISTEACTVMTSELVGAISEIKKEYLKNHYSKEVSKVFNLQSLLPEKCCAATMESSIQVAQQLVKQYWKVLGKDEDDCQSYLKAETKLWVTK
ncbi:hypothetical protein JTE90_008636 [Oedothorax gibbosus]|uniref:Uncharacterized protein n=1 Tax=Oedothorax gibbosus TaxID=931172 RepID=A0AAV6U0X3_9ARAC|nr:hypothetical protein JTE90_008636 [Oedothorax gibbosus]